MSLRELTPNRVHLEVGHWSDVGQRGYQEDRYCVSWLCQNAAKEDVSIVGVYDGHGGCEASQYLADRMCTYITSDERFPDGCIEDVLHDAFMDVDVDFINTGKPDGSTVNVCIFVGNRRVYCANAGDSRSVLVKKGGGVVALSKDHKPGDADETKRITDLGGTVVYWGRWRVQSVLAVSRSVGDAQLMPYITAEPNVVVHDVTEDDLWVVTASDGIWDVMDNNAVGKFMWQECGASDDGGDDEFLKWSGRKLCDEAGRLLSGDNVTAVVTRLN
jgi:serine/threonine protein phosphatase PrpC